MYHADPPSIDLMTCDWRIVSDDDDVGVKDQWFADTERITNHDNAINGRIGEAWQRSLGVDFVANNIVWYATTVEVPLNWNAERARILFESVANHCTVWINGKKVGDHVGDYVPFQFDISRFVESGATLEIIMRAELIRDHITKGFHDVLSIMHGGIWLGAHIRGSGELVLRPNGLRIDANADSGAVGLIFEFTENISNRDGSIEVTIRSGHNEVCENATTQIKAGATIAKLRFKIPMTSLRRWSPDDPNLFRLEMILRDADGKVSERINRRFGFRTITTRDEQIVLNGEAIFLRGILHWGHEPTHLSPAVPINELRDQMLRLKEMGFNCIGLCMWYPPEYFFDLADELGMLVWQEHPVWQSRMEERDIEEYKRLYREFMRRDANHPAVIVVSATCEHPKFHPDLAKWWWKTARKCLPNHLLQVQTASFAWSNPDETDLYDEHTYDNNNRWVTYLEDLQDHLRAMKTPKPFVMGETILFTSWPDLRAIERSLSENEAGRWWVPKGFQSRLHVERVWRKRFGDERFDRFIQQGDRYHLLGRQFQMECFRSYRNHAGLVMNHLRDVPACTCGFMDDFDRWRFEPSETRGWLSDAILLLRTPGHRRSVEAGEQVRCEIGLSNFCGREVSGDVRLQLSDRDGTSNTVENGKKVFFESRCRLGARNGEVRFIETLIEFPSVKNPKLFNLSLVMEGIESNSWRIWVFPRCDHHTNKSVPSGIYRLCDLSFSKEDAEPDESERGYSRGFGLAARRWVNRLPDPNDLAGSARPWQHDESIPTDACLLITHRLIEPLLEFLANGGAVIHFASKTKKALPNVYDWFFGAVPMVVEPDGDDDDVIGPADHDWVVDLLGFDLTRQYARMVPVHSFSEELQSAIQPIVRLAFTHDLDEVRFNDMLFEVGVGGQGGRLIVSSFDHRDAVGRYLLDRLIERALGLGRKKTSDARSKRVPLALIRDELNA